jgi:hypothetical protein
MQSALAAADVPPQSRAEELALESFAALYLQLQKEKAASPSETASSS